ncbi:SMI1/KNR4 family protein [Streptomyces diacarni]|uniref:SMI1/KNR4 family protein n=1 Tax=Streptomyces diacarni TaxID=2800381 RepID=UPI0033D48D5F
MSNNPLSYWSDIEDWLRVHAPASYASLRGPASADDITGLERAVGVKLCDELRALFHQHDGTKTREEAGKGSYFYPKNYRPLTAAESVARHHMLTELLETFDDGMSGYWWHSLWVPIAEHVTGDVIFVDHRQGSGFGSVGKFDHEDSATIRWPSLSNYLRAMLENITGRTSSQFVPTLVEGALTWRP